jgi:VIT1/CCC1 family predicted Fe2+/Mn2+ transporter
MVLGAVSAKTGGATVWKFVLRIAIWGTIAMGMSAGVGTLFGINI